VATIKAQVEKAQVEYKALGFAPGNDFSRDMLGECPILRRGQQGAIEVSLDEGQLRFSYLMRNGQPYFTDVQIH
jgi:hypothetical protein